MALKADYKSATGSDWKPGCVPPQASPSTSSGGSSAADINNKIVAQGDKVRDLKSKKAAKVGLFIDWIILLSITKYAVLTTFMFVRIK